VRSASDQTALSTAVSSRCDRPTRFSSRSRRQIAEDFGLSDVTLRSSVKQAERDEGKRPGTLSTDESEEPPRMRREHQTLRMEHVRF
jgi:transposase-like protein